MEIDLQAPGTVIRLLIFVECCVNTWYSLAIIFDPASTLQKLYLVNTTASGVASTPLSTEAILLAQWHAAMILGLTVVLAMGIPNYPGIIELRRVILIAITAVEALWAPLLLFQASKLRGNDRGLSSGKLLANNGGLMIALLLFRLWVLFVKPSWMGKYRNSKSH